MSFGSDFWAAAGLTVVIVVTLHVLLGLYPSLFSDERLQVRRKLQHITTGLLFFSLDPVFDYYQAVTLLWFGTTLIYSFHRARMAYPPINKYFLSVCKAYLRPHELYSLPGAFYFFVGLSLTVTLFPRRIALLSLLYLSVGDPVASFFGILYGSRGPKFSNGKSLLGMAAMIALCFSMTMIYLWRFLSFGELCMWALVGSTAAGLAESSPMFQHISADDNLKIPVVSSIALWILQQSYSS